MLHQHQRCPLKVTLWAFRLWLWIANKDHISKLPEQPWYFNSAVAWHIFPLVPLQKLETSKGLDCFSPWRCASPLGVSQMYFVWQQAWVVHLVWQSVTSTRLSAGKEGHWKGQCRAPLCQRGLNMLMPPTAEPSAVYYMIVTWWTVTY